MKMTIGELKERLAGLRLPDTAAVELSTQLSPETTLAIREDFEEQLMDAALEANLTEADITHLGKLLERCLQTEHCNHGPLVDLLHSRKGMGLSFLTLKGEA